MSACPGRSLARALGPRCPAARSALRLAAVLLWMALPGITACGGERRPNVLLIVVDTLRADRLGCYGGPRATTPALDALASVSLRFERAFAHAPWTTPSVAALLSSRYPSALGITRERSSLPADVPLLPELLRDAGYATGAVVSHHFVSARWGFARGFDFFDESMILGHHGVSSPGVSDRAIEFVDAHAEEPFFLFLHYFDPHFAYIEHEGFRFGSPAPGYAGPVRSPASFLFLVREAGPLDAADRRELLRIYDSEVAFTDHHVGRVLGHLAARGLLDATLVVFTADHGEEFLDHGTLGHTRTLYDELLHVPLLVKRPGHASGERVARPVGLVDVMPTIAAVAGVTMPEGARGASLLEGAERPIYAETARQARLRAVIDGDWKLVHDAATGELALYDRARDPAERRNLRDEHPRRARSLARRLRRFAERNRPRPPAPPVELSDAERARLRSLGYLE